MEYISVIQFAEKYGISERTARNYCAQGKMRETCICPSCFFKFS